MALMDSRRRGPRGDISADLLLAAAERVLAARGLPGLSLRAVAREADVTPTAVYTYFADMADLRHRIGDRFLGTLDLDLLTSPPAAVGLEAFLRHVIDVFAQAPGHVQILASQRILGPHALAVNEALLTFFIDRVGHTSAGAAAATDLVTEWVHGTAMLSPSNLPLTEEVSWPGFPRTTAMLTGTAPGTAPETSPWTAPETSGGTAPGPERHRGEGPTVTSLDLVVRAVTASWA